MPPLVLPPVKRPNQRGRVTFRPTVKRAKTLFDKGNLDSEKI
jgi:hypothetical protein